MKNKLDFIQKYQVSEIIFLTSAYLYLFLFLNPVIHSGYYGDDRMWVFITRGMYEWFDWNFFQGVKSELIRWIEHDRFAPIAVLLYRFAFYCINDLLVYKYCLVFLTLLNVVFFYLLVKKVSCDARTAKWAILCLPILFQFRILYHDSLTSYHGLVQVLFLCLMLSLLFLLHYLDSQKRKYLFASVILYLLCLLTYELALVFPAIYFALIYNHHRKLKTTCAILFPFIILDVILTSWITYQHFLHPATYRYSGTNINFDIIVIFKTFFIQAVATLPFTFYRYPISQLKTENLDSMFLLVALCLCYIILLMTISSEKNRQNLQKPGFIIFILGLLMFLTPAIPISFTQKYQTELAVHPHYLRAHLPVYIQSYGLVLILTHSMILLYDWIKRRIFKIMIVLICTFSIIAGTLFTFLNNHAMVNQSARNIISEEKFRMASEAGLFNNLSEKSIILLRDQSLCYTWAYKFPIFVATKKKVTCISEKEYLEKMDLKLNPIIDLSKEEVYIVFNPPHSEPKNMHVSLAKISELRFNNPRQPYEVMVSEYRCYLSNDPGVRYVYACNHSSCNVKKLHRRHRHQNRLGTWIQVRFKKSPVLLDSIRLF